MLVLSNVHLVPGLSRLVVSEAGNMHAGATVAAPKVVIMGSSVHLPDLETAAERNSELRSSLRNFESQNEYGYKPCIKRRFQNAETLQSRNQKNSS